MPSTELAGDEPADDELVGRLRLVIGRLHRRLRVDASTALPPLQTAVLASLEAQAPRRLVELARQEGVTSSTMSRVLTAMVRSGLVARQADPADARSCRITLSEQGARTLALVRTQRAALLNRRLARLSSEQCHALEHGLPALESLYDD